MTDRPEYIFSSSDEEARRLGLQALLYGGLEPLEPLLAADPAQVLDVGAGAGHYAALLAARLPGGQITGIELNPEQLARARRWHDAPNLTFTRGDLRRMPFADGSFDLTLTRFVLAFQADASEALGELARVTRPGGLVACHEMIHDGIWFSPARPAVTRVLQDVLGWLREAGGAPNQGLHIAGAMARAGLEDVHLEPCSHLARAPGPLYEATRTNWAEMVRDMVEQVGANLEPGLGQAALDELAQPLEEDLFLEISTLAWGRAPSSPPAG